LFDFFAVDFLLSVPDYLDWPSPTWWPIACHSLTVCLSLFL